MLHGNALRVPAKPTRDVFQGEVIVIAFNDSTLNSNQISSPPNPNDSGYSTPPAMPCHARPIRLQKLKNAIFRSQPIQTLSRYSKPLITIVLCFPFPPIGVRSACTPQSQKFSTLSPHIMHLEGALLHGVLESLIAALVSPLSEPGVSTITAAHSAWLS